MNLQPRAYFLILFLPASFLFGLVLAPGVFNSLIWLARNVEALEGLRNVEFERVVSRVVVITSLLGFALSYRMLKKHASLTLGWSLSKGDVKTLFQSLSAGLLAVLLIYVSGWCLGVYTWAPESQDVVFGRVLVYLPAVVLIAWIEETLFRGVLFKGLLRSISWKGAAWISSVLYALVHFAKPDSPIATVYGHWYSGFQLIPHTFSVPGGMAHIFPYAFMLTLLGFSFALATYRTGKLYAAAGLHAGVILGLKIPSFLFKPVITDPSGVDFFGVTSSIDKSFAAFVGSILLIFWVKGWFKPLKEEDR